MIDMKALAEQRTAQARAARADAAAQRAEILAAAERRRSEAEADREWHRARVAPKPKPEAPVDLLPRLPLFAGKSPHYLALTAGAADSLTAPVRFIERPAEEAARGWREALARVEQRGRVNVRLSPSGRAYLTSPAGAMPTGFETLFLPVAEWIAAGLRGEPWACEWCETEAATLLVGGVPACEAHA